jgi:4'-phosphopantetheinyl transferase
VKILFFSIADIKSKKTRSLLTTFKDTSTVDFSELKKKRPSLEIRRMTVLALTRSLLVEKGLLSYDQANNIEIHRLQSGQPILKSLQTIELVLPSISISHSGSWIACCLSAKKTPVCLDIEDITVNRPYQQLSAYTFSNEENQFIMQAGQLGFYKLWSAKEAIAKCRGQGLNHALKIDLGFQLTNSCKSTPLRVNDMGREYYIFQSIIGESILLTLAQNANSSPMSVMEERGKSKGL